MKIGIISDTHIKVKKAIRAIDRLVEDGAEFIIHAGDIVELEILDYLENSKIRYIAVYGNNDAHLMEYHNYYNLVQEPYYFKLDNLKFKLMHLPLYMAPDVDIVIYGHTHYVESELKGSTLFLNSGEICARKKPTSEWMMLETTPQEYLITQYTRQRKSSTIEELHLSFKRELNE